MNVYEYIALGNRFGASQIVSQFGMQPADNPADLSRQLATAVMRGGEEALQRVMMMHPDASYFLGEHQKAKKEWEADKMSILEKNFSNANGQVIKSEVETLRAQENGNKNTKDLLIIGGMIVLALAIIKK